MFIDHREQCQMYNIYGLQDKFYKIAFEPRGQAETFLKIEDLRSNKTTGKLS